MIYVFLADGFEEIEALATVDFLRRAGLDTVTVGVGGNEITGSHNITVKCDTTEEKVGEIGKDDAVVLPGGMPGTLNLENSETVQRCIDEAYKNGRILAAICAAPSVLGHKNLLEGKEAICFPALKKNFSAQSSAHEKFAATVKS